MSAIKTNWESLPLRDFNNLSVIKEQDGEVIATVDSRYAEAIKALPELVDASNALLQQLSSRFAQWGPNSPLGRFQKAIEQVSAVQKAKQNTTKTD